MSDQLCSNKRVQHSNPHINITSRSFLIKRHIVSTYFWSCCVCLCTCFCISSISLQCLIGVGVPGCRAVTLMALLIEAFLSPAWLNSNGLRFDFPTGTRQERANNNTQTHTSRLFGGKRSMQGGGGGGRNDDSPPAPPDVLGCTVQWHRQRDMIIWLVLLSNYTLTWG